MTKHFETTPLVLLTLMAGLCSGSAARAQTGYPAPPPNYSDPRSQEQYGYQDPQGYEDDNDFDRSGQAPTVEVGFFYNELSPYGEWVHRYPYGWVWFPRDVPANWRPYAYGRWVDSDYGWTWVSDEPFGWATYHYGRWAWDPEIGWVWVPGTVWGPAWVAWQQGSGYVGWAPLPPEVGFQVGLGLQLGGLNLSLALQPTRYAFVPENDFLESRVSGYILPPARNVTIIHNTTNITNYTYVDNRVINNGVPVDRIERATGHRVRRVRINETSTNERGSRAIHNDQLNVYRPPVQRLQTVRVGERNNAGLHVPDARNRDRSAPPAPTPARPPVSTEPTPDRRPQTRPIAVAPRVLPIPNENIDRRQRQQQSDLKKQEEDDRRRLAKIQKQDKPPVQDRARVQEVVERHATEAKTQEEEHQRAEAQLRTRQQLARQAAEATARNSRPAPPPAKPVDASDKNRNRDRDKAKPKNNEQPPPPPPPRSI